MKGLHVGDVVDVLNSLPSGRAFDVILADPPYRAGKDFGNGSDRMELGEYLSWTDEWMGGCIDRLADGGLLYVYGFPEILARIAARWPVENQKWLQWHYTNKVVPQSKWWQRAHESIMCMWRPGTSRPNLDVDRMRIPYSDSYKARCASTGRSGRRPMLRSRFKKKSGRETRFVDYGGALPRDVISVPALAGGAGMAERWFLCRTHGGGVFPPSAMKEHASCDVVQHPTQKPAELTRRLLESRIGSDGGRVLIPFAGSGSECVVAQSMGTEWLGVEINPEYAALARGWIEKAENPRVPAENDLFGGN